jgi:hypothetical protein
MKEKGERKRERERGGGERGMGEIKSIVYTGPSNIRNRKE